MNTIAMTIINPRKEYFPSQGLYQRPPVLKSQLSYLVWLKAVADEKLDVTKPMIFIYDWVENIVRKEENAGFQHFLLFPRCFQNFSFSGSF